MLNGVVKGTEKEKCDIPITKINFLFEGIQLRALNYVFAELLRLYENLLRGPVPYYRDIIIIRAQEKRHTGERG